jgi:hypothetical protein
MKLKRKAESGKRKAESGAGGFLPSQFDLGKNLIIFKGLRSGLFLEHGVL